MRLESAQPLPAGWCGKNFACHQLAALARHPLLIFLDADVRVLRSDSLARLARFMAQSRAALVSGVPREETRGLMEKLIVPLIHFVLLGFLPLRRMRTSTDPRFAAACGQILAVRRIDYERAGGHAAVADRLHDAVALARTMRAPAAEPTSSTPPTLSTAACIEARRRSGVVLRRTRMKASARRDSSCPRRCCC